MGFGLQSYHGLILPLSNYVGTRIAANEIHVPVTVVSIRWWYHALQMQCVSILLQSEIISKRVGIEAGYIAVYSTDICVFFTYVPPRYWKVADGFNSVTCKIRANQFRKWVSWLLMQGDFSNHGISKHNIDLISHECDINLGWRWLR